MSEPVTALAGATSQGIATVRDAGLQGMIGLRADLSDAATAKALKSVIGRGVPDRRAADVEGAEGVLWMSPDEVLILCPYGEAASRAAALAGALKGQHALATDISDARAVLVVEGPGAREVLAKLCPVDLSPAAFGPGMVRRTRMAQIPAAFWMDRPDAFRVVCFRSVARYAFDLLSTAARPASEVAYFA